MIAATERTVEIDVDADNDAATDVKSDTGMIMEIADRHRQQRAREGPAKEEGQEIRRRERCRRQGG